MPMSARPSWRSPTAARISGGFGIQAAATDPSYAVQSAPEKITGSARNDIILPDDFAYAPQGTAPRVIDVTVTPPTEELSPPA